jgi:tripartite-type tricarboxylate transporter receptor subunit TctC
LLERYSALSISPGGGTPAQAAAFIKQETQRWSDVIRAAGIQPQ